MNAVVLTIGTEILDGSVTNSNAAWLSRRLSADGVRVVAHVTVGDVDDEIEDAVRSWIPRCDLMIVTGGLGATPDDRTRACLARALGRPLVFHEPSANAIRQKLRRISRRMDVWEDAAAHMPLGAEVLENPVGLAPGFLVEEGATRIVALPGVPAEMTAMIDLHLPSVLGRFRPGGVYKHRTVHTSGVPETHLVEKVAPVLPEGVEASYLPHHGRVDVRLRMEGEESVVDRVLGETAERVAAELGDCVYGRDGATLEGVVGELLVGSSKTLAVAESLTGGALGAAITRVPGSSRYFQGGVVAYSNRAKEELLGVDGGLLREHGAVSAEVAVAMARGARKAFAADIAVSTTGIAGPTGATPEKPVGLVYIGIDDGGGPVAVERRFGTDRSVNVRRTVNTALNLLRLRLLGRPVG